MALVSKRVFCSCICTNTVLRGGLDNTLPHSPLHISIKIRCNSSFSLGILNGKN